MDVILRMDPACLREFYPILQQGFALPSRVGCSVAELLCEEFGLGREYVVGRITTIFLDAKPVDAIDTALVRDGARLALSAAMPGLVGATLRSGGFYAAMRGNITHREYGETAAKSGIIHLKLFNMLLTELGPLFLRRGILLDGRYLADFLFDRSDIFWQGCWYAALDGEPVKPDRLQELQHFAGDHPERLSVTFGDQPEY